MEARPIARGRPLLRIDVIKILKIIFSQLFLLHSACVYQLPCPSGTAQSILFIKEIGFDFLIDNVAQRLVEIELAESMKKFKISRFSDFYRSSLKAFS